MRLLDPPSALRLAATVVTRYTGLSYPTRWALVAAWYGLIFVLSHSPGTDVESTGRLLSLWDLGDWNGIFRLVAHLGVFGVLAALVYGALAPTPARVATAFLVSGLLGFLDEVHQGIMPLRHFRWIDVATNLVGAGLAVLLVAGLRRSFGTNPVGSARLGPHEPHQAE